MQAREEAARGARRERTIRLAVVTSVASKLGTVLLQLLAMPLAVRVLGREEFGLYATVTSTLAVVHALEIGVGPALAHGLSETSASGDVAKRRRLASTAFMVVFGIAIIAFLGVSLVLANVPFTTLYGERFAGMESSLRPALWLGVALFALIFLLNLTDRMREGLLEVAYTNSWGAAGNVIAGLVVGIGIWHFPQVWFLVLAVFGTQCLMKVGNLIMLLRKHPELLPRPGLFDRGIAKSLLADGSAYSIAAMLVGIVEYHAAVWMVGKTYGPAQSALYGVFVQLTVMQLGFVIMLTTPTWPAVAEALVRNDLAWARKSAKRLYLVGGLIACAAFGGMAVLGPWAMEIWLGESFRGLGHDLLACYGAYAAMHIWRHIGHALMLGTGQVQRMARIQTLEMLVMLPVAWYTVHTGGIGMMLAAMAIIIALFTGWALPSAVWQRLRVASASL
ncbi:MAG: hypothetical protein RLZ97_314 [Verrucomicrobiota bacterium]